MFIPAPEKQILFLEAGRLGGQARHADLGDQAGIVALQHRHPLQLRVDLGRQRGGDRRHLGLVPGCQRLNSSPQASVLVLQSTEGNSR